MSPGTIIRSSHGPCITSSPQWGLRYHGKHVIIPGIHRIVRTSISAAYSFTRTSRERSQTTQRRMRSFSSKYISKGSYIFIYSKPNTFFSFENHGKLKYRIWTFVLSCTLHCSSVPRYILDIVDAIMKQQSAFLIK